MNKPYQGVVGALPRRIIDENGATLLTSFQGFLDVVHLVADMVDPFPTLLDEFGHP
jgi:hypothetical protein